MSFARLHKLVTYLYASLGLFIVASTAEIALGTQLFAASLVLASVFAEGERIARTSYQRLQTGLLFGVAGLELASFFALDRSLLTALVELTMALSISRLAQRRSAAEHKQIAAIAILHLLIGTIVDTGLTYASVFLGFLVATPWMMALTHLRGEIEKKFGATRAEDGALADEAALARVRSALESRELATPRFLLGSAALALPLFLVTALFFLVFPRVGSGFLDVRAREGERVAGFGDEIELGGFGAIRDDPTVVLRVYPPDMSASAPPSRIYRMRGTSFDTYDGRRWTHGRQRSTQLVTSYGYHVLVRPPDPDRDRTLRIQAEPVDGPIAFTPEATVAVRFTSPVIEGRALPREAVLAEGSELRLTDETVPSVIYDAVLSHRGIARDTALDEEGRRLALVIPAGHERVIALAERIARGATSDAERAERLARHLRDEGRYRYSLAISPVGDTPPLVHFLFKGRRGHCEYFASSLAIMLRAVGIPSRTATGFLGGELNPYGRYYALRQGDAHSWVEAYIDGAFHMYDPTPPSREEFTPQRDEFSFIRDAVDALRARWATDIVGFDFERQTSLFKRFSRRRASVRRIDHEAPPPERAGASARKLLPFLALGLLAALLFAFMRRNRTAKPPEIVALYAALDRALARRGFPRPSARSPRAHLDALERAGLDGIEIVRDVTRVYTRVRYEGAVTDEATIRRLHRQIRALSRRR